MTESAMLNPKKRLGRQRGFSLMEILVGVAIGLLGIVVMFQTIQVWEARKRTTSSGSDAQIAGTLAMFALERDVKLAGYGFGQAHNTYMGTALTIYDALASPTNFNATVSPVRITNGAAGAPDTITVLWGNSSFLTASQAFTASSNTTKKVDKSRNGFQLGDVAMACGSVGGVNRCTLVEITDDTNVDGLTLGHTTGAYTNFYSQAATARYNPAASPWAFSAGSMYNLGPRPQLNTWQICSTTLANCPGSSANNTLAWSDALHSPISWTEVGDGIIDLQAQYGYDDNDNGRIDCPNPAAGPPACEWVNDPLGAPLTLPISWSKVRSIRVALLARSQQYEKDPVYTPAGCAGAGCSPRAPEWSGGFFAMASNVGGAGADASDWRHYRYRVYERVMPFRNIIWGALP